MKLLTVSSFAAFAVFLGLALHAQDPGPAQAKAKGKGKGRPPAVDTLGEGPWDLKTETGNVHVTVVTKGLDHPWGLAFVPNGDMLVTERADVCASSAKACSIPRRSPACPRSAPSVSAA